MSLGERISQLRQENNISQLQLAQSLDVSRQAVSKWENDQSSPDTIHLIQLADILNTDIEFLATGRRTYFRRPPQVITTVKTVEKVIEKPVYIEKIIEKTVDVPVIQYIERPVESIGKPIRKHNARIKHRRKTASLITVGVVCFVLGVIIGILL